LPVRIGIGRRHIARAEALLRQSLVIVIALPAHDFTPENHVKSLVAARGPGAHVLAVVQRVFAAFHMIRGPLLHLLGAPAGIVDVQMAELALHDSLLFQNVWRPT
jgi:hypothetical protein